MTQSKTTRKSQKFQQQTTELAAATPQVVAHRLAQMASSGLMPSNSDQREMQKMVSEKQLAFTQSWFAMTMQFFASNQELAMRGAKAICWPRGSVGSNIKQAADDAHGAALDVLSKGIEPVHKTAVANAKRLSKARK